MDGLTFQILGSLRALRCDRVVPLRAAKPRRLLATLLFHPNRFVSTDLLLDVLWTGTPPRSAVANVRTYVRTVREAFGADGPALETHHSGYSLTIDADALDASRFAAEVGAAARLGRAGDDRGALGAYERGLRLWRGRPVEDLDLAPAWEGAVTQLERLHRTAVDELIALRTAFADHAGALVLLRERLADDPYDEDRWCRLVECLLATGRRHEARAAYAEAGRVLAEELEVEPGEALRAMGAAVSCPASAPPPSRPRNAPPTQPVVRECPSQLPFDVPDFTGREEELRRLREVVCGGSGNRAPVAVIAGPPGTGKTTLAVRLGHLLKDVFTDGQIYLDMGAAAQPRSPSSALFEILRSLGVPDMEMPLELDRRAAVLRSELASRRVLVILDDVGSAGQVASLLPGTGDSALVITSRRQLSDLTSATQVHLDVMAAEHAVSLLRGIAGANRVDPDDAAAAEIVRACGNLPLAIRIAGSRLAGRRDLTLPALASRLRDERGRLDELSLGELAVRSSADLSYRALNAAEARLYRLVGLLGAVKFPAWALQAVPIGCSGQRCLDSLIEANLVQIIGLDRTGTARYRMHDLLRLHAGELARRHDPEQARGDLDSLLRAALRRARVASRALPVHFSGVWESADPVEDPGPALPGGPIGGPQEAIAWFDLAQPNLVPLLHAAGEQGLHEQAWRLASAWTPYFDLRGHFDYWRESHELALRGAKAIGSARGEATILCGLGQLALYRDDWDTALDSFTTARRIFRDLDDLPGLGVAAARLGVWHTERGQHDRAMALCDEALRAFVDAGDEHGEAVVRNAIALSWLRRGDPAAAEHWLGQAFALAVRIGDEHREAQVRRRIGILREVQGDLDAMVSELRTALSIFERLSDDHCASHTRASLGEALLRRGDRTAARRMFLEALTVVHRRGDRNVEAYAAAHLGQLLQDAGRTESARRYLVRALRAWQLAANPQRSAEMRERLRALAG